MPTENALEVRITIISVFVFFTTMVIFSLKIQVEGIRLIRENKLWAGLVFVDFPEEDKSERLPEFIRYKIRLVRGYVVKKNPDF